MSEKRIIGRAIQKHDIEENWLKATGFTPMQGEIIIYDIDENYNYERFKIGDGESNVNDLPFAIPEFLGEGENSLELGATGVSAEGDYSVATGYAHTVNGVQYPTIAKGTGSTAMGKGNTTYGKQSVAFGCYSTTGDKNGTTWDAEGEPFAGTDTPGEDLGKNSIAAGYNNSAWGESTVAMGSSNTSMGKSSVTLGNTNKAYGYGNVALGFKNNVGEETPTANGTNVKYYGHGSGGDNTQSNAIVAIGRENHITDTQSVGVGTNNKVYSKNVLALGTSNNVNTNGDNSLAIGQSNDITSTNSITLGYNNIIDKANAIAIGSNQIIGKDKQIVIGNGGVEETKADIILNGTNGNLLSLSEIDGAYTFDTVYHDFTYPIADCRYHNYNSTARGPVFIADMNRKNEIPHLVKGQKITITINGIEYNSTINEVWGIYNPGSFSQNDIFGNSKSSVSGAAFRIHESTANGTIYTALNSLGDINTLIDNVTFKIEDASLNLASINADEKLKTINAITLGKNPSIDSGTIFVIGNATNLNSGSKHNAFEVKNNGDIVTDGDILNIDGTSKIPTKISQLTNDSKYITSNSIPTKTSQLENDSNYIAYEILEGTNTKTLDIKSDFLDITVSNQIYLKNNCNINLNHSVIKNLATPTDDTDAATKEYVDSSISNVGGSGDSYIAEEPVDQNSRLGDELITADGWTLDGWTGDLANGFTHTIGSTGRLTFTLTDSGTRNYYLEFDVTSPTGAGVPNASTAFTVTIGNSARFITYNGGGSKHYVYGIKSVENGNLEFIPTNIDDPTVDDDVFDGTISNISLREIISETEPTIALKDTDGNIYEEKRILYNSTYTGINSGMNALNGSELNVSLGDNTLSNNTTGYWNTAVGYNALKFNTVGSRNVGIGKMALEANVVGDRNVGIGSFALCRNVNGRNNIGIGADALWNNTSGSGNIALGLASLGTNTTGHNNIAIGHGSGQTILGDTNIAIGLYSMSSSETGEGNGNIALGYLSLNKNQANYNVGIGNASLRYNTTGRENVAIGVNTLETNISGLYNVAIGAGAGRKSVSNFNVFVGGASGENVTGQKNTIIGSMSASSLGNGSSNVVIGYEADAASDVTNTVTIGCGSKATKSNSVVIGNEDISETLLNGDLVIHGNDDMQRKVIFNSDNSLSLSMTDSNGNTTTTKFAPEETSGTIVGSIVRIEPSILTRKLNVTTVGGNVLVTKYGKNLIPYPYTNTTKTINGITFTDNGDGTITANGTATANADFQLITNLNVPAGTYLSDGLAGQSYTTFETMLNCDTGIITTRDNLNTVTADSIAHTVFIRIRAGFTANNLVFKPQLEVGAVATDYEQYVTPETITSDESGNISIADSTNVITLKTSDNSNITVEYSKTLATKEYVDEQIATLTAKIEELLATI